jgi:hypothetical protein
MPPFGNIYQVPVYIDRSLVDEPYIIFQAGTHHTTVKIAMSDYQRLVNPVVGDFTLRRSRINRRVGTRPPVSAQRAARLGQPRPSCRAGGCCL